MSKQAHNTPSYVCIALYGSAIHVEYSDLQDRRNFTQSIRNVRAYRKLHIHSTHTHKQKNTKMTHSERIYGHPNYNRCQ